MVFPKNWAGIWFFLHYRERWYFFFPKIWSYTLDGKRKIIFLKKKKKKKKKYMEIWHFIQMFSKDGLFKKNALSYDLSCIDCLARCIFYPKTWYFFFGWKTKYDLSQEIHGNMVFSVYTCRCCKHDITPLCQKKSRMIFPYKNTPKGDWYSRLTF